MNVGEDAIAPISYQLWLAAPMAGALHYSDSILGNNVLSTHTVTALSNWTTRQSQQ
jgi:hypothetical protein